jgi:tRNA threonylcarbamoyl adenosine modification protein (Sua5/YciO/YrdC/YwlC family)
MILQINPQNPEPEKINRVVAVLQKGGIIIYPTDTIYGLGCDIFNKDAIKKIYQLKKREGHKPMSIICADFKDIAHYAQVSNFAFQLMKRTLPGAYTYVLKAKNKLPATFLAKNKTVGIRIPDNKICLAITRQLGHPIISTSLNISGEEPLTLPKQLSQEMANKIDLIIDNGLLPQEPSTVVDLTSDQPIILRQGKGDSSIFKF